MVKKALIEDTFKLNMPNDKECVKSIQLDFKNIVNGNLKFNQGTASLSVNIIDSKAITIDSMKLIKGIASKWTPSHINKLAKMFVRDVLEDNFKTFDKVKKQALKKSMKIAVAIIEQNSLGKFQDDKSINARGEIAIKTGKFTTNQKKVFNKSGLEIVPLTVKDCSSYASEVLGMNSQSGGSVLKATLEKIITLITSDKHYDNVFEDLPSDCRFEYSKVIRKLTEIENYLNKTDKPQQIYKGK